MKPNITLYSVRETCINWSTAFSNPTKLIPSFLVLTNRTGVVTCLGLPKLPSYKVRHRPRRQPAPASAASSHSAESLEARQPRQETSPGRLPSGAQAGALPVLVVRKCSRITPIKLRSKKYLLFVLLRLLFRNLPVHTCPWVPLVMAWGHTSTLNV